MIDLVLDASVVVKWFGPAERYTRQAHAIRQRFFDGEVSVVVPSVMPLELLNVAGRRLGWDMEALLELATTFLELEFEIGEAHLSSIAVWTAKGLSAYDATYVALAEARGLPLITDDEGILSLAKGIAKPLARGLR